MRAGWDSFGTSKSRQALTKSVQNLGLQITLRPSMHFAGQAGPLYASAPVRACLLTPSKPCRPLAPFLQDLKWVGQELDRGAISIRHTCVAVGASPVPRQVASFRANAAGAASVCCCERTGAAGPRP